MRFVLLAAIFAILVGFPMLVEAGQHAWHRHLLHAPITEGEYEAFVAELAHTDDVMGVFEHEAAHAV